ncbi:LysR family transcriptional regulator [Pelagibacteraceae bacterium]|jgi:DNA-binding transcriptional LysR family regulator|nr:LysR family transcriptional regulator [Pelagibacteraceae bacterium]
MDWRRIQIFAKICGNKSFTAAARIIGKSQSTLSRDVIQLEKKIGFKVFERNIRGIELTEQGKKLLMIANEFNFKLDKI